MANVDTTTQKLTLAEIYTITCTDGSIAYFTSHDANISYGGNTYQAIPISRTAIKYHANLEVDSVEVSFGLVGVTVGTKTYTIPQIIRRNLLREAHVQIWLVDWSNLALVHKILFDGYITGNITFNQGITTITVGSLLDKLKEKFPKVVYTEFCNHALFSTYCGLQSTDYVEQSSVISTLTNTSRIYSTIFNATAHSSAGTTGYWTKGKITFTSTASSNYNFSRTIINHGDGYVDLLMPFDESVAIGDDFDAWPGCDKSGTCCNDKYGNYAKFFGFEYIPKPEVLYG